MTVLAYWIYAAYPESYGLFTLWTVSMALIVDACIAGS